MSIKFDSDKEKTLSMMVETSGIEKDTLDFTFNIVVEDIKYGFPCCLDEGKVIIKIPALKKVITDLKSGEYMASLEVTGNNKYFMKPFNEMVTVKQDPKVDVVLDTEPQIDEDFTISLTKLVDENITMPEKPEVKEEKKTKDTKESTVVSKMFN